MTNIKFVKKADLRFADLAEADLAEADLAEADLSKVNLRDANLRKADLRSANLEYSNLEYSNLTEADLSKANLESVNLRSANLESANLRGANLYWMDFNGIDLTGVILDDKEFFKIGKEKTSEADKELQKLRRKIAYLLVSQKEEDPKELEEIRQRIKLLEDKTRNNTVLIDNINQGFEHLKEANDGLEKESKRLNRMFNCYVGVVVLAFVFLILVWFCMHYYVEGAEKAASTPPLIFIWLRIAPSFFLLGLIGFFIPQINRVQTKLENLKKFFHRIESIRAVLKCFVYTIEKDSDARLKINETLDLYVKDIISAKNDLEKEAKKNIKDDEKDESFIKKIVKKTVKEVLQNRGNI